MLIFSESSKVELNAGFYLFNSVSLQKMYMCKYYFPVNQKCIAQSFYNIVKPENDHILSSVTNYVNNSK